MRKININYTSDVHGYFYPTTYGDMEEKNIGLFKCYSQFIHDEDTLTIDGGDILQGSAFNFYCEQERSSRWEPIVSGKEALPFTLPILRASQKATQL